MTNDEVIAKIEEVSRILADQNLNLSESERNAKEKQLSELQRRADQKTQMDGSAEDYKIPE